MTASNNVNKIKLLKEFYGVNTKKDLILIQQKQIENLTKRVEAFESKYKTKFSNSYNENENFNKIIE